jgi:hypothetical protein
MLELDLIAFDQLVETSMKASTLERIENLHGMRLATQDEGKAYTKYLKQLQKEADAGVISDGRDLQNDLAAAGNYK